jgi:hypothetical protein
MNGNFWAGLALSLAIVVSAIIASSTFLKAKRLDQMITVTGSSKRRIKSDLMIWGTSVTAEAPKLAEAYAKLTQDVSKVHGFLVQAGVSRQHHCGLRCLNHAASPDLQGANGTGPGERNSGVLQAHTIAGDSVAGN